MNLTGCGKLCILPVPSREQNREIKSHEALRSDGDYSEFDLKISQMHSHSNLTLKNAQKGHLVLFLAVVSQGKQHVLVAMTP